MAIGAAIADMDGMLADGKRIFATVTISCTHRPDFMEGRSVQFEIGDDGISLATIEFVPTGQGNSCDHQSRTLVDLTWKGGFRVAAIETWLGIAKDTRFERNEIRSEIIGLPEF